MLRAWHANRATSPLKGSDANCKPDLILLPVSIANSSKDLDWRDVVVFGEIKSKKTPDTLKNLTSKQLGKLHFFSMPRMEGNPHRPSEF
jgi:hypothetical protein